MHCTNCIDYVGVFRNQSTPLPEQDFVIGEIQMEAFRKMCSFILNRADVEYSNEATRLAHDFLSLLSRAPEDRKAAGARRHLENLIGDPTWGEVATLFRKGIEVINLEIASALKHDRELGERLHRLETVLDEYHDSEDLEPDDFVEAFWEVFCPQAAGVRAHWEERTRELRRDRTVHGLSLCPDPLQSPAKEVLFSANVLITTPPLGTPLSELGLPEEIRQGLTEALEEDQAHWYDHPVQIGTSPEQNEILHGLKGLSNMLIFEKERGNASTADRLDVILSVSVTHPSLQKLARTYIEHELSRESRIRDLNLWVFTEEDTSRIVEDFLCPAARRFGLEGTDPVFFSSVFGVDGPYARHYNFLKAMAALWQVVVNPGIRATFKIDLDQVFPQEQLVREVGASAFELLCTPLWGAQGLDPEERPISLGMIAGALVNQGDIHKGLFTPDVTLPKGPWQLDQWLFASQVPQALSTAAEMMTRYGDQTLDGESRCLSRIHVTGGTIGVRLDSLRRHRPFTLSCIGRAEDQAYLMSVLYGTPAPYLRYAHVPGLIMRHDKYAFAGQAIRSAAAGKLVGDYERMLLFSRYAKALPWPHQQTRSSLDPFTGSFVLPLPFSTALLCLTLKALSLSHGAAEDDEIDPEELLRLGACRLGPLLERFEEEPDWMERLYEVERKAWNSYYEILDRVEEEIRKQSAEATRWAQKIDAVIRDARVATR